MLHKPRRTGENGEVLGADGDEQASSARSLEATLEERARSMLEKVVGAGHVDVRVTADLDRARVERVEDRYDPKQTVLRSEQSTVERTQSESSVTGVPGSESNLPNGSAAPDGTGKSDSISRESHTRNFEVDHVTEKRLVTGGTVRRLTVAVVVDGVRGKDGVHSKEEVERLTALVRSAVGADEKRGDLVTVESVPFLDTEPPPAPAPRPLIPENVRKYVPYGYAALAGLGLLTFDAIAVRMRRKAKKNAAEAKALALVVDAERDMAPEITPIDEMPVITKLHPEELRSAAHERAAEDPATAALVLRFWLGEGDDRPDPIHAGAELAPASRQPTL
jgi:flagellar M-ring protein FliF